MVAVFIYISLRCNCDALLHGICDHARFDLQIVHFKNAQHTKYKNLIQLAEWQLYASKSAPVLEFGNLAANELPA
jgi:hypothetical protein